jgi:hypothetical protein
VILPPEARPLVAAFVFLFTNPTYQRFSTLLVGALLTTGRRTVANLLRTLRHLAPGHRTDYQRVLSRASWSGLALGCALMRLVLDRLVPDGPVVLVGDDTVDGHKGKHVYGKARHRDAVRSTHTYTAWRYGHRWVVLAVLVKLPFANRPWALPVLIDLYRSAEDDHARKRPHRTPARIMCGLLRVLLIRFPDLFHTLPAAKRAGVVSWPGKATVTFSDALCVVRRWLWAEAVLPQAGADAALDKLPTAVRELLLTTLAPAA